MSVVILHFDNEEASKKQRIDVRMSLAGGDTSFSLVNVPDGTPSETIVKSEGDVLVVSHIDKIERKGLLKVLMSICYSKKVQNILQASAKLHNEVDEELLELYNECRLLSLVVLVGDADKSDMELVFPMDIGSTCLSDSLYALRDIKEYSDSKGVGGALKRTNKVANKVAVTATLAFGALGSLPAVLAILGSTIGAHVIDAKLNPEARLIMTQSADILSNGNIATYSIGLNLEMCQLYAELHRVAILLGARSIVDLETKIVDLM